jgi:hypothetical protein
MDIEAKPARMQAEKKMVGEATRKIVLHIRQGYLGSAIVHGQADNGKSPK